MSVSSVLIAVTPMSSATTILALSLVHVLMVLKVMVISVKMSMSAPHRGIIVIEMPVASTSTVDITVNVLKALLVMASLAPISMSAMQTSVRPMLIALIPLAHTNAHVLLATMKLLMVNALILMSAWMLLFVMKMPAV